MKRLFMLLIVLVVLVFTGDSMAAQTITVSRKQKVAQESIREGTVDFDTSYPTGGESMSLTDLSLKGIYYVVFQPTSGYFFEWDYTNKKVKVFYIVASALSPASATATEVASATDLSALTGVKYRGFGYSLSKGG